MGYKKNSFLKDFWWWMYKTGGGSGNSSSSSSSQKSIKPECKKEELDKHLDEYAPLSIKTKIDGERKQHVEFFDSISVFLEVLETRPTNKVFQGEILHSILVSRDRDSFTGTRSYEEAVDICRLGYKDILDKLRNMVEKNITKYQESKSDRDTHIDSNVGYAPNVPKALMNLPQSMINIQRSPRSVRTLDIVYFMVANCNVDKQVFIGSGSYLLSAIELIERQRIRVQLRVSPFCSEARYDGERVMTVVKVKEYTEKLSLLKLCFPLAHPSFFRRMGFKWLETFPELSDTNFVSSYGRSLNFEENNWTRQFFDKSTIFLDALQIRKLVERGGMDNLLKYINNGTN